MGMLAEAYQAFGSLAHLIENGKYANIVVGGGL